MSFVNAQKRAKEHPDSFVAPALDGLKKDLRRGCFIKVCEDGERYWIKVTRIDWPAIHGTVNSDLVMVKREFESAVTVQAENVYELTE